MTRGLILWQRHNVEIVTAPSFDEEETKQLLGSIPAGMKSDALLPWLQLVLPSLVQFDPDRISLVVEWIVQKAASVIPPFNFFLINKPTVGLAVISLGNCWRLTGCNDVATHINIAEHYSIYYTKHCSLCYVVQLYKSILTYSIQLAWNLAMSFDERCSRG